MTLTVEHGAEELLHSRERGAHHRRVCDSKCFAAFEMGRFSVFLEVLNIFQ